MAHPKYQPSWLRGVALCFFGAATAYAPGQETRSLSLEQAIALAKERNGAIVSAVMDLRAARSRERAAFGAFLPVLTPTYQYLTDESRAFTGQNQSGWVRTNRGTLNLTASWRLLDSGERMFSYRTAQSNLTAQEATSLQTLRTVLFSVHQRYYDALRARELLRVATLQVERTQKILDQTRARVRVGDAPEKDILQAEADYLNAEAASLAAQTQVASSEANLKATIGWAPDQDLPPLVPAEVPDMQPLGMTLDQAQEMGLRQRPDLAALRQGIIAQRYGLRLAEVNAGITFTLDANYRRGMAPDVSEDRNLTFLATIPLYDGSRSRESVGIQRYQLESRQANLVQAERNARAEIEAAYKEFELNGRRLAAAGAALNAAKRNYEAAIAAQERGAQGTNIITVLTANVSLVTAESGYVQALHDLLTSQVRLRLVLGEPIVGDELK